MVTVFQNLESKHNFKVELRASMALEQVRTKGQ